MKTTRKKILETTFNELQNIHSTNGYKTIIKDVFYGFKKINNVSKYPSVSIAFAPDLPKQRFEGNFESRDLDLLVYGYLHQTKEQNGNLTFQFEDFVSDIYKFFKRSDSIVKGKTSSLIQFEEIESVNIGEITANVETEQPETVVGIQVKIVFYIDPSDIENKNVSAMGDSAQV